MPEPWPFFQGAVLPQVLWECLRPSTQEALRSLAEARDFETPTPDGGNCGSVTDDSRPAAWAGN
eukprot:5700737-Pyramimonas_sp.AAC.1